MHTTTEPHILDGLAVAKQIKTNLKNKISQHIESGGKQPCLAVILVGADPASQIYVNKKQQACEFVGIKSIFEQLPEEITEEAMLKKIDNLNKNEEINGILVQLPLPSHIDSQKILERIDPKKDVDGFHPYNLGRLAQKNPALRPCTPFGIMKLLEHYDISLKGKEAVIVGSSNIVGRPLALEFLLSGATVTVCHRSTQNLEKHIKNADILAVGIGNPNIIKSEWIKPGAIVIDIGINRTHSGKIVGDINFETAKERASWITPVPGGVGPMTVAILLENTWLASLDFINH